MPSERQAPTSAGRGEPTILVRMVKVDPDDDSIRRYVVRRYAFDPDRGERRHQIVAAFDTEQEYRAYYEEATAELQAHRDAGLQVDPRERYTGMLLEPGHRQRAQDRRLLLRALQRRAHGDRAEHDP